LFGSTKGENRLAFFDILILKLLQKAHMTLFRHLCPELFEKIVLANEGKYATELVFGTGVAPLPEDIYEFLTILNRGG
jgi:hypothetical protein